MFKVEIDFDESSKAWRRNKISIGNGHFKYICGVESFNKQICKIVCKGEWTNCDFHSANIYEVEAIYNHKTEKRKTLYLVKWKNYAFRESTWEPESNFLGEKAIEILLAYKEKFGKK